MNISISGFSKRNYDAHSLTLYGTAILKVLKINEFRISRSINPLFYSNSYGIKYIGLKNSQFYKYLSSAVSIFAESCDNNECSELIIENSLFQNMKSSLPGGAIGVSNDYMNVFVKSSTFISCSSTASVGPNIRPSAKIANGGACFFSIYNIEMKKCLFNKCVSYAHGAALYTSVVEDNRVANFSRFCDISCGEFSDAEQTIYTLEKMIPIVSDINSSYSRSKFPGIFFIGSCPSTFSFRYSSVICDNVEGIIPLGISTASGCEASVDHIFVKGSRGSYLICCWYGSFFFDQCVFSSCTGDLYKAYKPIKLASFNNCIFDSGIVFPPVSTTNCQIAHYETYVLMKCQFGYRKILYSYKFSCELKTKIVLQLLSVFLSQI